MRKILFGIVIAMVLVFGLRYCEHQKDEREQLEFNTAIIQKQIKNVGKLVVIEGSYAEVFSYADSKKFYFDMFSSDKKALVIVNAKASISYDLSKIETKLDADYDSTTPGTTIRERIMKISGISSITVADHLATDQVLMIEMKKSTVRLIEGIGLQNIEWSTEGRFVNKYKVITIRVPQIRSDRNGSCGIVHASV